MAQIKIELSAPPVDGMDVKFQAPCDCTAVTGIVLHYPAEDGSAATKELTFRDAHGNNLAGIGNLFSQGAYVKVIVDVGNGYAYIQNADTNGYLNSVTIGTYTQDNINLTGSGENGKFKATESGTFGSFNVNGEWKQVKCGEESSMDLIAGCWYTFILDGDTVNFNAGGAGGGGLNFAVVGNPQPVSPKENTIWIDTDVAITSYIFAAAEPSDPVEGMVWISTGTASTAAFNALKKNSITLYPMSASQYIDGAWASKIAKTNQGGEWVDWAVYLYRNGNTFDDVTGGYFSNKVDTQYGTGSVTFETTQIELVCDGSAHAIVRTEDKMDLSSVSTLLLKAHVNVESAYDNHGVLHFYATENAITDVGQDTGGGATVEMDYAPGINDEVTISLDVSGITGSKYIFVALATAQRMVYASCGILEIRGE